jgi:dihydroorotase/N-acyl-D-amino-acid deacylase
MLAHIMRLLLVLLLLQGYAAGQQRYDLVIRNAKIVDGAGGPWFRGDLAVKGDQIAAMGRLGKVEAEREIDAAGLVLAPGFLDIHSHSRGAILDHPDAENVVRQGVTTVVDGNDGGSPLPLGRHFDEVRKARPAVNYASFVGHGSIRREVIGNENRKATREEIEQMRALTRRAMQDGAWGVSSGLFYLPGMFASTEEVAALGQVASEYGGMHISHMRDEADHLLDSVKETIAIGEQGGLPTQVTHHKAVGKAQWGMTEQSLALVDEARKRGVDVTVDQYPYTASHTGTAALFPPWVQEGGKDKMLARLADPEQRARARDDVAKSIELNRGGGDPKNIQFSTCGFDESLNGKTLADATTMAGREVTFANAADTAIEIQEKGGCSAVYHAIGEEDVQRIMQHPAAMIGSDGGVVPFGEGVPHPRNYGTFPRVLGRYVRELGVIPLEEAVRKMTSLPAGRMGIWDRGLLRPGLKADLVVFNPDTIADKAEFGDPHHYAEGVEYVIVSGALVLDGGKMTGLRPGRVLLGPGAR